MNPAELDNERLRHGDSAIRSDKRQMATAERVGLRVFNPTI